MPAWTSVLALVAARLSVAQAASATHWIHTNNPPLPDAGYPQNALFCKSTTYRGEWGKQRGNTPLGGGKNRGNKEEGAPSREPNNFIICPEDRCARPSHDDNLARESEGERRPLAPRQECLVCQIRVDLWCVGGDLRDLWTLD